MAATIEVMDLVKSAVGAGVIAALVNQGLVWIKEWLREGKAFKLRQQHAALSLAVALERYALVCAHQVVAIDQGLDEAARHGNMSYLESGVPELTLPAPSDAQCLPADVVARVLALPLEIRYAQEHVRAEGIHVNSVAASAMAKPKVGQLGWDAWNTAITLRRQQNLPPASLNIDVSAWDFRACLQEATAVSVKAG